MANNEQSDARWWSKFSGLAVAAGLLLTIGAFAVAALNERTCTIDRVGSLEQKSTAHERVIDEHAASIRTTEKAVAEINANQKAIFSSQSRIEKQLDRALGLPTIHGHEATMP